MVAVLSALSSAACSTASEPQGLEYDGGSASSGGHEPNPDSCEGPREGCPCPEEGVALDCGKVTETHDDYVTCSTGSRTCTDGFWGACVGERITLKQTGSAGSPRAQSLGAPEPCPEGFDVCDPYCNLTSDTPGTFDPGPGFSNDPDGLTLIATGVGNCSSLTLTPSATALTVTDFSPLTASPNTVVTFSLSASPPGCTTPPFDTTWTLDKLDRALVTGTNNTNGRLTLAVPIAGSLRVTAYAIGLSASADISVKVNVLEAPTSSGAAAPNQPATSAQINAFGAWNAPNPGTTSSTAIWLYPYEQTYFPLALPAPVIQWWYSTSSGSGRAAKVSLRYPTGAGPTDADFNYSLIVGESNVVSQSAGVSANNYDPQVVLPELAWRYFERTARGNDADILIQRRRGSRLERESRRSIHFVDAQLKGTVYYNSYTSPQGGNTGAVLSIAPGATSPTLAVQPSGRCTVCHTINTQGTRLIANGRRPWGGVWFNNSQLFDLTTSSPSPTVLEQYNAALGIDTENVPGNRYTFGAPWGDGSLYMTHGGRGSGSGGGVGDANWRSPPDYSGLYRTSNPNSELSVTNWPSNMLAVTPKFSPDGTKLAFGYWGGNSLPKSPSGSLSPDSGGDRLAVVDFSCSSPPCTSSSSGWRVTNARDMTPSVSSGVNRTTGTLKVAWPTFAPSGNVVFYQRQYRSSRSSSGGGVLNWNWSPSDINTVAGALAEIWMSDVPANANTAAKPTRLLALNGLNSDGSSSYLPEDNDRISSPGSYHRSSGSGTSFTINQADWCSNTGTANNVLDYRLNYLPAANPTEAGGHTWVVFTSRRMYGNVAFDDPWDAEPGFSCNSGNPPAKKLWVAAIDANPTPGVDPSHPAFYLPGQELEAGNSDGYWVNSLCASVGASCESNDDCCGGTGSAPTTQCKVVSASTVPPARQCQNLSECSSEGQACSTSADCCAGLTCPDGGGACLRVGNPVFEPQVFEREYVAVCPDATLPKWRFFEWQATIPSGTSIDFSVQTKDQAADSYVPVVPLAIGSATSSTPGGSWHRGPNTVDEVLDDASLVSRHYLLVTMTFNPDAGGNEAPTLNAWRQIYDCVWAE